MPSRIFTRVLPGAVALLLGVAAVFAVIGVTSAKSARIRVMQISC